MTPRSKPESELNCLQKSFEEDFINKAKENKIFIDKVTPERVDNKQLRVRYQYHEKNRM